MIETVHKPSQEGSPLPPVICDLMRFFDELEGDAGAQREVINPLNRERIDEIIVSHGLDHRNLRTRRLVEGVAQLMSPNQDARDRAYEALNETMFYIEQGVYDQKRLARRAAYICNPTYFELDQHSSFQGCTEINRGMRYAIDAGRSLVVLAEFSFHHIEATHALETLFSQDPPT